MSSSLDLHRAFSLHRPGGATDVDARFDETLLAIAAEQGPTACIWQAGQSLVVPRTYRRFEAFEHACNAYSSRGWPVVVRQTGGGIVPQGPGIVNVSLAYPVHGPAMRHSEPGYQLICEILEEALAQLGVQAFASAVEDSFCDGRYNLAVNHHGRAVKVAGTAQMWKRLPGSLDTHIGLVHALVLVDTDTGELTQVINTFEEAIGNERRYSPPSVISIAELLDETARGTRCETMRGSVLTRYTQALEDAISRARIPTT